MIEPVDTRKNDWFAQLLSHLRTPLYRNGYILSLNAAVTSGLGLVYWVLATRYYRADLVGTNAALLASVTLLSGGAQLSLNSAMVRFIPIAGRATLRLVGSVYLFSTLLAVVASLVFGISAGLWSPTMRFLGVRPDFLVLFVFSTLAWCIFSLQDSVMTGLRQTVWILAENGIFAVVKIVLLMVFTTTFLDYGIFASWLIPIILSLFPINILIFRRFIPIHVQTSADRAQPIGCRQISAYIGGNYPAWLFFLALTTLLPIMVADRAGASAGAHFYLPWMIINSLRLVALNMATSLTVEATVDRSKLNMYCYRVLVQSARLVVPMVVISWLIAPTVLRVFGSEYALEGTALMRLLALAAVPDMFISIFISLARVRNQPAAVLIVHGTLCIVTLSLSYLLLPALGIIGVGIAYLATQTGVALVLLLTQLQPAFRYGRVAHQQTQRERPDGDGP